MRDAGRAGVTLVESVIVLLLLLLVLGTVWTVTAGMGRAAAELADRGESLATTRAASWILQEELEGVLAPRDLSPPAGDSFSIRAFRGAAVVCAARESAELVVGWSGVRDPDSSKDSVLALRSDGTWTASALAARGPGFGSCAPTDRMTEERWTLDPPAQDAVLLRFFERGSYHLTDDAFRYRIGAGGRQPLTPPTIDPDRSALTVAAPGRIVLRVGTRGSHLRRPGPAIRRAYALTGRW